MNYQIAVTEAAHNALLLHLVRCMVPMLENNVRQNFELLYSCREILAQVSSHRAGIFVAIVEREPDKGVRGVTSPSGVYCGNFAGPWPGT